MCFDVSIPIRLICSTDGPLCLRSATISFWHARCRRGPSTPTDVRHDLREFLDRLAPEAPSRYRHNDEGPDDMPAHLKAMLTQVTLTIPVTEARLQLGTWQGVFLLEHRAQPHRRELVLTLIGE